MTAFIPPGIFLPLWARRDMLVSAPLGITQASWSLGQSHLKAAHTHIQGCEGYPLRPHWTFPCGWLASSEHAGWIQSGSVPGGPRRGCIAFSILTWECPQPKFCPSFDQSSHQRPLYPKAREKKYPNFGEGMSWPFLADLIHHTNNAQDCQS